MKNLKNRKTIGLFSTNRFVFNIESSSFGQNQPKETSDGIKLKIDNKLSQLASLLPKQGPGVTDKPAPVTQQDVPAHPDNLFGTQNIPGATPNNVAPAPVTQHDVPPHKDNLF